MSFIQSGILRTMTVIALMCGVALWGAAHLAAQTDSTQNNSMNNSANSTITLMPLVLTGQVSVSYGYNPLATQGALFLHFGGPCLTLKYGDWSFGLGAMPSLRLQERDVARPNLGFGPTLGYKRWLLVAPIYFDAANGKTAYILTIGIGYRF